MGARRDGIYMRKGSNIDGKDFDNIEDTIL